MVEACFINKLNKEHILLYAIQKPRKEFHQVNMFILDKGDTFGIPQDSNNEKNKAHPSIYIVPLNILAHAFISRTELWSRFHEIPERYY